MKLSYVIATRNNRAALLRTLEGLERNTGLPEQDWEVLVVDNASSDGTGEALAGSRRVRVICLSENEGVPARNLALAQAAGRYVALLGDDVCPSGQTIARALAHLGRHPKTAAVVGRVVRPDGSAEAPALPSVLMGTASVIRRAAFDQLGGFAAEFFRQEADYELSFRFWRAGYRIERFEDLCFTREAPAPSRGRADLAYRWDLRNNLILVERYLPRPWRRAYRHDWMGRYVRIALHEGRADVANAALKDARVWARREAVVGRKPLPRDAIEAIFQLDAHCAVVARWSQAHGIRQAFIADWGKNLLAAWRACREVGLEVRGVLENNHAFAGARYRGIPVLPDERADAREAGGIVLSTVNAAQVDARAAELERRFKLPVLRLWQPRFLHAGQPGPTRVVPVASRPVDEAA